MAYFFGYILKSLRPYTVHCPQCPLSCGCTLCLLDIILLPAIYSTVCTLLPHCARRTRSLWHAMSDITEKGVANEHVKDDRILAGFHQETDNYGRTKGDGEGGRGTEIREKAVRAWSQAENADLIDVKSTT